MIVPKKIKRRRVVSPIEQFKLWRVKAKDIFCIEEIDKKQAYDFICNHHYLGDAKYSCMKVYGLILKDTKELMGVAIFGRPNGSKSLKGWFGLDNTCVTIYELTRLCVLPTLNNTNATSFLLSGSMRLLKRDGARAVITLADSSKHVGSIYQVCNFSYYGLTDTKTDFFPYPLVLTSSGNPKYPNRVVDSQGVWLPRTRKHRYCFIFDKTLKVRYNKEPYPKRTDTLTFECCGGTHQVYDKRFNKYYTCPRCLGEMRLLNE